MDRQDMDRLARKWVRTGEQDPEGEWTLKMQGVREKMEVEQVRLLSLQQEMEDARKDDGKRPELSLMRLQIAKQASVVEEARRRLLVAKVSEEISTA